MKQFPKRAHHSDATPMTRMAIELSELSEALALEDRTLVRHAPGRLENVAEHSLMLAIIAPAIAETYYSDLDPGLVARFAAIHDAINPLFVSLSTHAMCLQSSQPTNIKDFITFWEALFLH